MAHVVKDVFGTVDYLVFAAMLVISAAIGIWYAYIDRKKSSTQEFLMGGRSLGVFPVALSVLASFMSAISLLGAPSEVYRYGTQYTIKILGMCLMIPTTAHLYMPVYYKLGLTSAYEYLELRFNRIVRLMGSAVFVLHMVTYISIVLYAPALALSEVTGIGLATSVISVGLVCTFYTSIGGIKAVVWTDVFQTFMMYGAIALVLVKGVSDVGGLDVVWQRNVDGGRIEFFRFDFDPTIRHTFWSLAFGGYITWMATYAANQAMIQRYLTIGTLQGAQKCLWINLPALFLLISMTASCGLVVYAYYHTCDPIGTGIVNKPDQVFPRFVMETLGSLPGVPGLFVSGVFSGALSTVSSGVNSLSAVVLEDFVKPSFGKKLTEIWATRVSKILALSFGLLSIALVFVAQNLGGILQASATIHGIVGGPMLGIFTLGLFFPYANNWGACIGLLTGMVMSVWFGVGAFITKPYHPEAPRSYTNCTELYYNATGIDLNNSSASFPATDEIIPDIFYPYKLSYMWLSCIGFVAVLVVGNLVSCLAGFKDKADNEHLSPLVVWLGQFSPATVCSKWIVKDEKQDYSEVTSAQNRTMHESKNWSTDYLTPPVDHSFAVINTRLYDAGDEMMGIASNYPCNDENCELYQIERSCVH